MDILPAGKNKKELELPINKETKISSILGISIHHFRSIKDQSLKLGSVLTLISGRNGTMKTSMMGLVAQLFDSPAKDVFDKPLKTTLSEVFKLSPEFDNDKYRYDLVMQLASGEIMREPVTFYYVAHETNRHRVVVSGSAKGDGTFIYNTSFLNLQRLYPIADTDAKASSSKKVILSPAEAIGLKDFYETVFPSSEYGNFTPIVATSDNKTTKTTFGPSSDSAKYDWSTISSGEDNLGSIYNRLIGFQRSLQDSNNKEGNGVLCIDEFESTLHPVAQLSLFDYLYRWGKRNKIQIIITTHSLYLISHIYLKYLKNLTQNEVVINFVSSSSAEDGAYPILHNPPYSVAYKELTFEDPLEAAAARKIKVFCEDEVAIHFIKRIVKRQDVLRAVDFHCSLDPSSHNPGTSFTALSSICAKFPLLLKNSLVIFDADISQASLQKIKQKDLYLILPDESAAALERRIITFIISLKNSDAFFLKFKKERTAFLATFKSCGIKSLSPDDILDINKTPIDYCKIWAKAQGARFKQYVTYYCDHLEGRDDFRANFISAINQININSGVPEAF
ncbi:AAA family ATPase [Pseudomonas viridiflava]|uniref:AAA family ATPase n=1 Tax=Pseudomonas viridiflava TaxID=33069 RepID=UPI002EAF45C2|nr:AAA family ATPase [Pseudomonas viridiflava]